MAVRRKSSIKRIRVDKRKHLHNLKVKTQLKKTLKKFQALLSAKNIDEAKAFLKQVFKQLDKAAKKKIIHPNTANRKKSRLSLKVSALKK
ncbi:MAG: 30S ribosomal protein S20 [Candidatus Omnitrophica bacterium]|nr:30S ribosomal protein S20 [Candidatus Omnitrophota bacterium]MDD5512783.1 30S ribosomal protein S20 [Candidatus Omnitrophota bacterium]